MRSLRILFSLLAILSSTLADAGVGGGANENDDVIELTSDNFETIVTPAPIILVEFMAPWCGHCKALMPEYKLAATLLKKSSIPLAKVDCTVQTDLCASHDVQGYPTLKIFSHGKPSEYKGPRKADGIVPYMQKRARPVVTVVTASNHTEFSQSDNVVVIAYLDPSNTEGLAAFTQFAESKRDDLAFGVCYDAASIKEVSSLPKSSLVVWKKFDEGRNDFSGEAFTGENIAKFVTTHSIPLFNELTPANFVLYSEAALPLAYTFIEANNPKRESLVESLKPIAKVHKGHMNFVWIDASKYGDYAKSLNLPGTDWPEFVIQETTTSDKYTLEPTKEVNYKHVSEFVQLYRDGKAPKSVKSQPVPKQVDGSYVLVASVFDEVVYGNKNQKDVFLEFYAPWCGHCKRLKHPWDNLARSFKGSADKVLIAKFDATENDIPSSSGISVTGYPTLKFKPAGSKEFIDYDGERSLDAMIEFVEKNSANKVKAVKVDLPEPVEGGEGSDQIVLDEESEPVPEDEDKDAEHDEL